MGRLWQKYGETGAEQMKQKEAEMTSENYQGRQHDCCIFHGFGVFNLRESS